jgi:hypothetical protein
MPTAMIVNEYCNFFWVILTRFSRQFSNKRVFGEITAALH